jgi:hypothetical protein
LVDLYVQALPDFTAITNAASKKLASFLIGLSFAAPLFDARNVNT